MSISVNLGKVIPSNAGNWSSGITYPALSYVKYNNGFYLSKIQNINKQPDINTGEWQVIVNADQVISNANTATQNANNATQGAIDATQNAKTATQNANNAIASISNIVSEFDNKIDLPTGGTKDQFIRGDGSIIDLAYGQFTISNDYPVPNPDNVAMIPIDTDIINHNINLDPSTNIIEIVQDGVYNITLNATIWNQGGEYSVIHIYDLSNKFPLASSVNHHFEDREYTLNCSVLNYFNQGDKIGFYLEYTKSPIILNNPVSYGPQSGFNPILTNVNIQQIK